MEEILNETTRGTVYDRASSVRCGAQCIFERGVSTLVMACLEETEAQGEVARYKQAQAAAPKLQRITRGRGIEVVVVEEATADERTTAVREQLLQAAFTVASDKAVAVRMLETIGVILQRGIDRAAQAELAGSVRRISRAAYKKMTREAARLSRAAAMPMRATAMQVTSSASQSRLRGSEEGHFPLSKACPEPLSPLPERQGATRAAGHALGLQRV